MPSQDSSQTEIEIVEIVKYSNRYSEKLAQNYEKHSLVRNLTTQLNVTKDTDPN